MSEKHHHHIVPFQTYVSILMALMALTVITVAVARIEMNHTLHVLIAILIATVKASLVGAYFMHLKYDDKLFRVILIGAVFFVIVMFTFCATDISTRALVTSTL